MADVSAERAAVLAEATGWLGTPYRHQQRVKGAGADCAMFPLEVYATTGLIERPEIAPYPIDWHLHRSVERYLPVVQSLAREVAAPPERVPQPGDFALVRFARAWAHGMIVTEWPICIHSDLRHGVVYVNAEQEPQLVRQIQRYGLRVFVFPGWGE